MIVRHKLPVDLYCECDCLLIQCMSGVLEKRWLLLMLISFCSTGVCFATHLRAADILVERVCGTLTFKITIIAYLNSQSTTKFGTDSEILFGDFFQQKIPLTVATPRPDLGININVATFTIEHTYVR